MELSRISPVLHFCTVQEVSGLDLVQKARDYAAVKCGS